MVHLDSDLTQRFARSYTTAAFGYARAASAAYAALANQTLDFWASRSTAARSDRSDTLSFVSGPRPYRSAYTPTERETPSPAADFMRITQAWAASPMFAPIRAWWSLFPLEGNPASWPMAHAMMTAGVPRSVALPAAEANLAAMDAAQVATASVDRAFSAYRSDSGFAVSQIVAPKALYGAMMLGPFATSFKFPWA
jgi:hypothetical protein